LIECLWTECRASYNNFHAFVYNPHATPGKSGPRLTSVSPSIPELIAAVHTTAFIAFDFGRQTTFLSNVTDSFGRNLIQIQRLWSRSRKIGVQGVDVTRSKFAKYQY
jgi:hypothetical protein